MHSAIRIDIQCLRGVAIILVILYHAELGFFPAGFLGVDIFFVISGFLITSLIKKNLESGVFSFYEFYFRRAKRLLPAAYATFLLTGLLSPLFLNDQEQKDLTGQMIGALTFTANVVLNLQADYFANAADLKPLLHVWSLSLEEQYYLLLPALLAFTPRRFWLPTSIALLLCSLGICLWLLPIKPIATFYLLPTRAWELGIGSLAAIAPLEGKHAKKVIAILFWPSVAVLLAVPITPLNFPHPGLEAILVCVATANIILRRHPAFEHLSIARGLARVGDASYSLYLAHWPPIAFLKNAAVGPITVYHNLLALLLGISLGLLLYRFIEKPLHQLQLSPSRHFVSGGIAASCCLIALSWGIGRLPMSGADFAYLRRPNDGFSSRCAYENNFSHDAACQNSDHPSIMVWGDSYAMHLVGGVVSSTNAGVIQATRGMCGPFANLAPLSNEFYRRPWAINCLSFNRDVLAYLKATPSVGTVVISSPFRQYLTPIDGKHHWRTLSWQDDSYVERDIDNDIAIGSMLETINQLRAIGKFVILVAPPPSAGFNIGTCLERRAHGKHVIGAPRSDCDIPAEDYRRFYSGTLAFLKRVSEKSGIQLVSFDAILCNQERCLSELDGVPIYVDSGHLTHDASRLLAERIDMRRILKEAP